MTLSSFWKLGIRRPIPKKGDLHLTKNWRPVVFSILMSKVFDLDVFLIPKFGNLGFFQNLAVKVSIV